MATGVDDIMLIECGGGDPVEASREQWNDGSNTLAIAPGKVCVYERNVVTNEALRKAGMSETELEGMWYGNGARVLREVLPCR